MQCHGEQLPKGSSLSSPQNRETCPRPGFLSCTEGCFRGCQRGCGGEGDVWFGAGLRKVVAIHQGNDLYHNPSLAPLGHGNKAARGMWKSSFQQQKSLPGPCSLGDVLSSGMRDQDCPGFLHAAVQLHSPLDLCALNLQLMRF